MRIYGLDYHKNFNNVVGGQRINRLNYFMLKIITHYGI